MTAVAAPRLQQVRPQEVGEGLGDHLSFAEGDHVDPAVRPVRIDCPAADLAAGEAVDEAVRPRGAAPGLFARERAGWKGAPPQRPQATNEEGRTIGHARAQAACRRIAARASSPRRLSSRRSHP